MGMQRSDAVIINDVIKRHDDVNCIIRLTSFGCDMRRKHNKTTIRGYYSVFKQKLNALTESKRYCVFIR